MKNKNNCAAVIKNELKYFPMLKGNWNECDKVKG